MGSQEEIGISVLIPIHKIHLHLQEAVQSSYAALGDLAGELLLVLDRLEIDTLMQKLPWIQDLARVRVIKSPGSGIVDALNAGLSISGFPLVARMDSDDVMEQNRLKSQLIEFVRRPNLVLLGGHIRVIDETGARIRDVFYPRGDSLLKNMLKQGSFFAHPAATYRKEVVLELGGYSNQFPHAEDYDLWIRLASKGEVDNLNQIVVSHRSHSQQVSKVFRGEQDESTRLIQRKYFGMPICDMESQERGPVGHEDKITRRISSSKISQRIRVLSVFDIFKSDLHPKFIRFVGMVRDWCNLRLRKK